MKHLLYMALGALKPVIVPTGMVRLRYVELTKVVPSFPRRMMRTRI